ncbi:MAG: hypothetical protein D3903_16600 [Candidatus Electrothrix sp. GM3_4]|nr:hypothetical protein [Candidatus Electrothrix sp. GM3_4]
MVFLSTPFLQAVFEGWKELFHGLYIYDIWDWQATYPVVKISFAGVARNVAIFFSSTKKNIAAFSWERV